jgi:hypothetical protein
MNSLGTPDYKDKEIESEKTYNTPFFFPEAS